MNRGLTSFRALAFLAVFAFHIGVLPLGYLGVQAFFVLSGFLLTPILVEMRESLPTRNFFISFYGRRMLRILPLYYLYLFVVLLISLLLINLKHYGGISEIDRFVQQAPWAFTYTYNFFYASVFYKDTPLLTHFWSLAVEEQFYLIWPLFIFFVNRKCLKKFLLAVLLAGPLLRLLIAIISRSGGIPFLSQQADLVIYALPFSHFDAFAMGGYFALYQASDRTSIQTLLLLYIFIPLGYLAQYLSTGGVNLLSFGYVPFMQNQYILGYSFVNFVFAKIIIQGRDGKFFPVLFDNPIFNYLGKISYGLYVFHYPIIWLVRYMYPLQANLRTGLPALALTIIIGAISYELFEKRFIEMKDSFFAKKPDGLTTAA